MQFDLGKSTRFILKGSLSQARAKSTNDRKLFAAGGVVFYIDGLADRISNSENL